MVTAVTSLSVGAVVSIVKELTERLSLVLFEVSVTVMVQSEYVPPDKVLKVIVLLSAEAVVVELLQLPP